MKSGNVILKSTYVFSIYSKDEKREDWMRNTKPIQIYMEEVKEAYKWWRPLQNKVL